MILLNIIVFMSSQRVFFLLFFRIRKAMIVLDRKPIQSYIPPSSTKFLLNSVKSIHNHKLISGKLTNYIFMLINVKMKYIIFPVVYRSSSTINQEMKLYGLLYLLLFSTSTVQAATSPCSDEFTATKCSNEQNDMICQEAFPVNEALSVLILIFIQLAL